MVLMAPAAYHRIVFEGDFTFLGESAHVRHTLTRQDPDSFSIVDEERVEGGGWRRLEVFYYHRRPAVS